MLENSEAASMCDIACREGTNHSYIARRISLTLLAPQTVAAILGKTLPEGGAIDAVYQSTNALR